MDRPLAPTPVFACLKWGAGYPARDTNTLYRALGELMSVPFRFACITDDPTGLAPGIETLPLPAFALPHAHWVPGMWPKLSVFQPGIFEPGTPVMLMDVDVVVIRDLAPMLARVQQVGGLHIIHDWHDTHERWFPRWFPRVRTSNSSVVGFIAGQQDAIWDAFHRCEDPADLRPSINDQDFIHHHAAQRHYWPDGDVLSFKKSLAWHVPVNFLRPVPYPAEAFVVAFHGVPNPEDVAGPRWRRWGSNEKFGYFPVAWVKAYLERYGAA